MKREHLVVCLGRHDRLLRRQHLDANQQRENASDKEEKQDAGEIHDPDAFMVDRGQPALQAFWRVEVVFPYRVMGLYSFHEVRSLTIIERVPYFKDLMNSITPRTSRSRSRPL